MVTWSVKERVRGACQEEGVRRERRHREEEKKVKDKTHPEKNEYDFASRFI